MANLAVRRRLQPAGGVKLNYRGCITAQPSQSMKTEARVIKANGEKGFAIFDSIDIGGKILLVLDRGQVPDIEPQYFHPAQRLLRSESGRVIESGQALPPICNYLGKAIDIQKYLPLPDQRRGFALFD